MGFEAEPIIINTDHLSVATPTNELWENRSAAYSMYDAPEIPKCSIMVQGYNRLHKTRYCVECILKYTQDVDYELILVDNGSDDGTYEFFQSVPYEKKQIIRVTKNIGAGYPLHHVKRIFRGKYFVSISNDIYVTKNWLSNLLKCYESDTKIGYAMPVSSNVSNFQQVDFDYKNFDEMQKKAAVFNISNPLKWEERIRLISMICVWSRQVIDIVGWFDGAFVHDFGEDDMAARLRRAGYKMMLCRDTWICHDHDFRNMEDKDPATFAASLESGRATYREKYHGIDAWEDINNFEMTLLSPLDTIRLPGTALRSLVVDGRCGTPVLEIRNRLKRRGAAQIDSFAFTTQAKYYPDLQTVAHQVDCDRIDFIQSHYSNGSFHVVALCEPVNTYPTPITLLQRLYDFLAPGGLLLFKLRNTDDFNALLRAANMGGSSDGDLPSILPPAEVQACLKLFGGKGISITSEQFDLSSEDRNTLLNMLRTIKPAATQNDLNMLVTQNFVFQVTKG